MTIEQTLDSRSMAFTLLFGRLTFRPNKMFGRRAVDSCAAHCAAIKPLPMMTPHFFPSDARNYLSEELHLRQRRRPQYSMRAFARDLEISPSFLCEFLAGRQGLSKERAAWITQKINLAPAQSEHFWDLIEAKFARTEQAKKTARLRVLQRTKNDKSRLSLDRFHLIADWYHFALLEILTLPESNFSKSELAEILNISVENVEEGIKRLLDLNLIERTESNASQQYVAKDELTSTEEDGANHAIQIAHQQLLRMHADAVETKSMQDRESLSVTFSIANTEWDEARAELKRAILGVLSKYGSSQKAKDDVAIFSMQMIRLLNEK